ncbi:restriction endonuclease subunit S domain-containing protein [Streptomyces griseoluteus]|uniref:hypothetical protein n=1 Tax=Streptomyces griseoluteus TaxID=29306 RepID=UPI0038245356
MSELTRLGDVVDLLTGFPFKSAEFVGEPDGIQLLRGDNIGHGTLRWDGAKYWPVDQVSDFQKYTVALGDVILAMDRPWISSGLKWAEVREVDLPCLLVQRVARLRATGPLEQSFLPYLISGKQFSDYVQGVQTGTAVPHISSTQIADFRFHCPSRRDQQAISAALRALDERIAVNERIAATADELAGLLFRGCSDLAPRTITDVADITMGQSPPGETYNETGDGLPFYQGTRDFGIRYPRRRVWCTAVTRYANENDVLVSVRAPVGEINVAAEECGIGRGVAAVRSSRYPHVLLHALASDKSVWHPYEAEGTVFGSINKKQFSQLELSWPSEPHIDALEARLTALDDRLRQAVEESGTLATLRDSLLPQLMSGRLRVKDAKRIVEDHV